MFGLKDKDLDDIKTILRTFPEVEQACIFGSRAKGNFKHGSDIDIAIKGTGLTFDTALEIMGILNEETIMPYHFDVINYFDIKNKDLLDHIDRVGKFFYKKEKITTVNEPGVTFNKKRPRPE